MKFMTLILGLMLVAGTVCALDDTPPNREAQAERYLKATPPEDMMKDMAENMSKMMPAQQRELFMQMMTKELDMVVIRAAMKDAMIKTYTADELAALADFNSSPVGKSAMKKTGAYMQAMMPAMMPEMQKAMAKATAAMKAKADANAPGAAPAPGALVTPTPAPAK